MKAIVIGGGMGGMTAALALEQQGFQTEVYEAVKPFGPSALRFRSGLMA